MKKRLAGLLVLLALVIVMGIQTFAATAYVVSGTKNYLAVRNYPATSQSNEIGRLNNGDMFYVTEFRNGFAYGYSDHGHLGWVNANYLAVPTYKPQPTVFPRTVVGVTNYLGLRTTPTRNAKDEIGRLYNGNTFYVIEFRNDGFAYGFAPNGQWGYVVSSYLR